MWILRQHQGPHGDIDLVWFKGAGAQLVVKLPKHSAVLHDTTCWEEAAWDVRPSCYATQLWLPKTTSALHPQLRCALLS
jgi:hypothetical protein